MKDPVAMNTWAEHTVSELKSNKKVISPRKFIEDYVPEPHRQPFEDFLGEKRFPLRQFGLNTADISRKMAMRAYHTSRGAKVVVPADATQILSIERERIVVSDTRSYISVGLRPSDPNRSEFEGLAAEVQVRTLARHL